MKKASLAAAAGIASALMVGLAATPVSATSSEPGVVDVDPFAPCNYMAQGTYFTTDPATMPLAANSSAIGAYVDTLPNKYLPQYWIDRGLNTSVNTDNFTIPIYVVDSSVQGHHRSKVEMVSWYLYPDLKGALEGTQIPNPTGATNADGSPAYTWADVPTSDPNYGTVAMPSFAVPGGGDLSFTVYDQATGIVRGYYQMYPQTDGSWLSGGGYVSVLKPGLKPFEVRASMQTDRGTSSVGGVMNEWAMVGASELAKAGQEITDGTPGGGAIPHVTSWTFPSTKSGATAWPAKQTDGKLTDADAPLMGQRFFLPKTPEFEAHLQTLGLSKMEMVVVRSLQEYGGIVTDQNYWTMALNLEHSVSYTSKGLPNPYLAGGIVYQQFGDDLSLNKLPWEWTEWGTPDGGKDLPQKGETVWNAKTDMSVSYSIDRDGDGTISSAEHYSNNGYLAALRPYQGDPGTFEIQHWLNQSGQILNYRLSFATDNALNDVTVRIQPDGSNFTLNQDLSTNTLALYKRFGGDPKYGNQMPDPTVSYEGGTIVLHWASIPANSANIFSFTGNTDGSDAYDPANHYLIEAKMTSEPTVACTSSPSAGTSSTTSSSATSPNTTSPSATNAGTTNKKSPATKKPVKH